jgi:polysaccharide pyruvyl transferase WcaK-like protein
MNDARAINEEAMRNPDPRLSPSREKVRTLALLDTSQASTNLGDHIIMEAVRDELRPLFADSMVFAITSHDWMGSHSRGLVHDCDWAISGGTSLLSSRMWYRPSWKVSPLDALARLDIVLMGAGWHQYQRYTDPYSKWLLRRVLSRTRLHSVRDGYTLAMLASIGIRNAVNTGCPTLWKLTPELCDRIPRGKARAVVTTVNSYGGLQAPDQDRRILAILADRYREVYLWIQTHTDFEYARSLSDRLRFIDPSVAALDAVLNSSLDVDYVGIRLHAGIRALQRGRRSIIVAIDNRAREMSRDFGLPTVGRTEFDELGQMIDGQLATRLRLPWAEIERWKSQFPRAASLPAG